MKTVNYSALNVKNKTRVDAAIAHHEPRPAIAHHTTTSTHCTKFVRSIVSAANPEQQIKLLLGGKMIITQIALDK